MILLPWLFAAHAQALELGASIIWEQNLHLWRWVAVSSLLTCSCMVGSCRVGSPSMASQCEGLLQSGRTWFS